MKGMAETIPWAADLAAAIAAHAGRVAVSDGNAVLRFADMGGLAGGVARWLLADGLRAGDPVVTSLGNTIPGVWGSVGARIAGAAEVALNANLTEAERRYCVELSGARRAVTTRARAEAFRALGCAVLCVEDVAAAEFAGLPPVPADAAGRIGFTSGTTGRPKAIVTSHGARWIANLLQRAHFEVMPTPESAILLMTPFVHGAGLLAQAFHDRGAGILLLDGVETEKAARALRERQVDFVFAPPTVLAKLTAALEGESFPHVRTVFTGTAPLTAPLYRKARAMFGPVIRVTYGKSEITNPITELRPAECEAYYAEQPEGEGVCVGFPGTGVEIEIRDEHNARLPRGEVGEVHLRGRHMSHGHIDANGFQPLPADGFHATGDLGRIDERGRLHLVGRVADVIKSGGYKIHPDEIEQALAGTAPAVAVVTLPSEYWGEVIVAVAEGADADWEARARAALAALARHKHPRAFLPRASLARNHQGKVMRRLIREEVLAEFTLKDGPYPELVPR